MPPRYAVIAGQLFPVPLAARPLLSISAFRAKFGLRVIWLSEVRVGGLFRVATPLVAGERPVDPAALASKKKSQPGARSACDRSGLISNATSNRSSSLRVRRVSSACSCSLMATARTKRFDTGVPDGRYFVVVQYPVAAFTVLLRQRALDRGPHIPVGSVVQHTP